MKKLLRTYDDDARYTRWLQTRTTAWLEAYAQRLRDSGEYYNGRAVRDRLDLIQDVLWERQEFRSRTMAAVTPTR